MGVSGFSTNGVSGVRKLLLDTNIETVNSVDYIK